MIPAAPVYKAPRKDERMVGGRLPKNPSKKERELLRQRVKKKKVSVK
jgi:hypothetical protein